MIGSDFGKQLRRILELAQAQAGPVRILVDGPSGSGKTTLAEALASVLGIPLYSAEYWVPGWDGLAEGTRTTELLVTGQAPTYRRWDWEACQAAEDVPFDASGPWIVEGCGALTPISAPTATVRVWVEAEPDIAKARGLGRDGDVYAPHWEAWNRQEKEHWNRNNPRDLADVIVRT